MTTEGGSADSRVLSHWHLASMNAVAASQHLPKRRGWARGCRLQGAPFKEPKQPNAMGLLKQPCSACALLCGPPPTHPVVGRSAGLSATNLSTYCIGGWGGGSHAGAVAAGAAHLRQHQRNQAEANGGWPRECRRRAALPLRTCALVIGSGLVSGKVAVMYCCSFWQSLSRPSPEVTQLAFWEAAGVGPPAAAAVVSRLGAGAGCWVADCCCSSEKPQL